MLRAGGCGKKKWGAESPPLFLRMWDHGRLFRVPCA